LHSKSEPFTLNTVTVIRFWITSRSSSWNHRRNWIPVRFL